MRTYTEDQKRANRERARAWAKANPERTRANGLAWKRANRVRANAAQRARYAADPAKARAAANRQNTKPERREAARWGWLHRKYGITREGWEALFAAQRCRCACCGTNAPGSKRGWHTDHDHATGKIRGIVCWGCNTMLGAARDNPDQLAAGVEYLRRSR